MTTRPKKELKLRYSINDLAVIPAIAILLEYLIMR